MSQNITMKLNNIKNLYQQKHDGEGLHSKHVSIFDWSTTLFVYNKLHIYLYFIYV